MNSLRSRCLAVVVLAAAVTAGAGVRWSEINRQAPDWYRGEEAGAIAAAILQYQTPEGGWPKNLEMLAPPTAEFLAESKFDHRAPTIDNSATTTQLRYLALVLSGGKSDGAMRAAFDRGLDYLLDAQYPSGGWPQYFPLIPGYYTHITYNDDAMVNVLTLLREVATGEAPFAFATPGQRKRAADAVRQGVNCILRTQVKQEGKLTVWCAQHDEETFAPAWARNFEPPSLSGAESVGIVRFLLGEPEPTPEIIAAVEGAVAWFQAVPIHGLRVDNSPGADGKKDRKVVSDPTAPVLWARFYELGTNRPIFTGRDKVIRYDFNAIERERRSGYNYLSTWPATLLDRDYPRWRKKHHLP